MSYFLDGIPNCSLDICVFNNTDEHGGHYAKK